MISPLPPGRQLVADELQQPVRVLLQQRGQGLVSGRGGVRPGGVGESAGRVGESGGVRWFARREGKGQGEGLGRLGRVGVQGGLAGGTGMVGDGEGQRQAAAEFEQDGVCLLQESPAGGGS